MTRVENVSRRQFLHGAATAGAFVLAATEARPDTFLLGIEAAPGYASLAALKLRQSGRTNGRVLVDNGKIYLQDRVHDEALDAVHVYFPDPWPKRRHKGRRFVTVDVPAVLARVLRDDGFCYVATDNAAYAGQVARVLGSARDFVRRFVATGRLVAVICHGGWVLIDTDVVRNRRVTSWPSLATDFRNAGAQWSDEELVVDRSGPFPMISSRKPADLPAFSAALVEQVERHPAGARR